MSLPSSGAVVLLCACSCTLRLAPADAQGPTTMFRYDPTHAGAVSVSPVLVQGMAWRFATGGKVRSTPAVAAGRVVFGSEDGFVYALEEKTGTAIWRAKLGGGVTSSPAIAGDRVIVLSPDGVLRALALRDGKPIWSLAMGPDRPFAGDPRGFDMFVGSPTVAGDTVYVGSGDGKVYAVDLPTGRTRWWHSTGHRVRSTPAVASGTVFVGSLDGNVYALDAGTGAERWRFQTDGPVQSSPAVAFGTVFVGSRSMAVFALDAATGRLLWRRPHSGSWVLASAAVAPGKVIIGGSDSHLLEALDPKTGAALWSVDAGARILSSVTVAGDVVVYGAEDFRVYTADLETGLGLSMEFTEAAIYSSPVLADGMVFVGSDDDHLYAFRTTPAPGRRDSEAPGALLASAVGRYRLEAGDEYALSLHRGRLRVDYAHYPPGLALLKADGTFSCPYFFGMTGRLERQPGQPATALLLGDESQGGPREVRASRVE